MPLDPPTLAPNFNSLPGRALSKRLFDWTLGARNRLYRVSNILNNETLLDLGAGWGFVSEELCQRSRARVTALDYNPRGLEDLRQRMHGKVGTTLADAHHLPFRAQTFEALFCQFAFLWFQEPARVIQECWRVLMPHGSMLCVEPDFGGLMEYPESGLREMWLQRLASAGACPTIGRALPSLLQEQGFQATIYFCDRYYPPADESLQFLPGLETQLHGDDARSKLSGRTLFLPLWLIHARKAT